MNVKQYVKFKNQHEVRLIPADEVMYVEQRGRQIAIVTSEGEYVTYGKLAEYVGELNESFYNPLKYLCVNLDNIRILRNQVILFNNGALIPMGRDSFKRTKEAFLKHHNF